MVEKIIVNPESIRGYGNILNSHSSSEYELEDCTISTGTDIVNGATVNVMTLTPTFSHSYSISFGQSSYTAVGGSCTVSVTLLDNNVAVSGATVSVSGSDGSLYSGITNNEGIAQVTVSNISGTVSFTCSYQSVTDTCTVTSVSYLFYDACNSSSGLSNYGSSECVRGSNATITMTYDSTENAYQLSGTGNYHAYIPIPALKDEDSYSIQAEFKSGSVRYNACGFYLDNYQDTTSYGMAIFQQVYAKEFTYRQYRLSSDGTYHMNSVNTLSADTWYKMTMTVDGSSLSFKLENMNGDTLATDSTTLSVSNKSMGIFLYCETGSTSSICYVRNIKAESL